MRNALNLRAFVPQLLVLMGWILRKQYIEVAGPVTTHVKKVP